jgi:hypothetical protein
MKDRSTTQLAALWIMDASVIVDSTQAPSHTGISESLGSEKYQVDKLDF